MSSELLPEWVKVQEETFKNWVNYQLSKRDLSIQDITTDFSDGIRLIVLLEILSGQSLGKYTTKPLVTKGSDTTVARQAQFVFRHNIEMALAFCASAGIRLENVGVIDLIEGNRTIILGMLWSLILHFQVNATLRNVPRPPGWKPTAPKHQLLEWVQSQIGPSTPYKCDVTGLGKAWSDGRFLSALVDSVRPGTHVDWTITYTAWGEHVGKCSRAIDTASTLLGVPPVLLPAHLAGAHCDELSLVTYISGFHKQFVRWAAGLLGR